MSTENTRKRGAADRFLDIVERVGNALPDPTTLFALSALAVIVLSGIAAQFDLAVAHPTTGEVIHPVSLLSVDGLHRILTGLVTNFTSFAPLGTVLVALIGIGNTVTRALDAGADVIGANCGSSMELSDYIKLARQIVKTWLETEFGGGRHARRVDKIDAIEKRFLRK